MVIQGRVENGVVVVDGDVSLPEGAEVSVVVRESSEEAPDKMTEAEHRRVKAIFDRLAAMPDENPGDAFSGADHDQVLYGEP